MLQLIAIDHEICRILQEIQVSDYARSRAIIRYYERLNENSQSTPTLLAAGEKLTTKYMCP